MRENNKKNIFFLFLALVLFLALFIYKDFVFGSKIFLFKDIGSDTINLGYPHFVHIADYLRSDGLPRWSFNQGMGQNIFPSSLNEPINWIFYLVGRNYIAYSLVYVEILKIILAGLFFYLYLKILGLSEFSCWVGGLLYSFSGYMILGGTWYFFSTEAVYAAFLLWAFEKFFQAGQWQWLPIPVVLIIWLQPFFIFLYTLFLLLYSAVRFFEKNGLEAKKFFFFLGRLLVLIFLGILISSVFLFPQVQQMLLSPRGLGQASYFKHLFSLPILIRPSAVHNFTAICRFFSSDLLGTGSNFSGYRNYLEAPIFYAGLVSLLLAPQIFFVSGKRQKILYSAVFILFFLMIIFPYFRRAFWGFTGDYYRTFSLLVVFFLIFFSVKFLNLYGKSLKTNIKLLWLTLCFFLAILYLSYPNFQYLVNKNLKIIISGFLIIYTFLICFLNSHKFFRWIFLVVLIAELCFFSNMPVNHRPVVTKEELRQKIYYNDNTIPAVNYLNSIDSDFFRIVKDYTSGQAIHASFNDAQVQKFKGTTSYAQFNQFFYIKFLAATGIINPKNEAESRWARGLVSRPLLQTVACVKYLLSKNPNNNWTQFGYDLIATFGDVRVYQNNFFLPLGYTYDRYLLEEDFQKLSNFKKDVALLGAFVINQSQKEKFADFKNFSRALLKRHLTFQEAKKITDARKENFLEIQEFKQNLIKGRIKLKQKKILFFSIPYDTGWQAKVDGRPAQLELVNIGFMGLVLEPGGHSVELCFTPPFLKIGALVSLIGILVYVLAVANPKFLSYNALRNYERRTAKNSSAT